MKIPQIDLVAQYRSIRDEIDAAIHDVLERGLFILGPQVAAFEAEVAAYLNVRYAVGVASGTDALILALKGYGIGPGDEVIVPAYTFFATAEAVSHVGATPVFVDIEADTYAVDVRRLEACITPRTRAVIPVHLYGHPAEMTPILGLARRYGLKVIEDAAQALGAEYRAQRVGGLGDVGCLSFFPSKTLGGYGDGGMVVTNDHRLADAVRKLRTHGWRVKYEPEVVGYNSRLDELQASILRVKLKYLDTWNDQRRELADRYAVLLAGTGVGLPIEMPAAKHVYHVYVVRVADRDVLRSQLTSKGIGTAVYYPGPLHRLRPYLGRNKPEGTYPVAEAAARETLALPLYAEMTEEAVATVATAVGAGVSAVGAA
jgi:dTDP-4-amino-4,6-dideoxygalactose transaminase